MCPYSDTWDPFQLNPIGAEKESKRTCFQVAQYLVAAFVGIAVLTSAVIAKVGFSICVFMKFCIYLSLVLTHRGRSTTKGNPKLKTLG